jgi:hypothetical protein
MDKESWRRGGDSQPAPRGESSFDELAKNLADGSISRRKALRFIGGAFVGGLLASIPGTAWAAKPPPPSKGGCPPGRTQCRGKCVDLQTDRNNCGRCSNVCSEQESCWGGTCCSSSRGEQFCEAGVGTRICCPPNTYCAGPRLCCQFNQINCGGQCVSNDCQCCDFEDGQRCCPPDTYCAGFGLCCPFNETACGGQCVSTDCQEGTIFSPRTCRCETAAAGCTFAYECGGAVPFCGSGAETCLCTASVEGPVICGGNNCGPSCTSSAECEAIFGPGAVCQAPGTGCCGQRCIPACGSPSTTSSVSSTGKTNTG